MCEQKKAIIIVGTYKILPEVSVGFISSTLLAGIVGAYTSKHIYLNIVNNFNVTPNFLNFRTRQVTDFFLKNK